MQKTMTWVVKHPGKPAEVKIITFSYTGDDDLTDQFLKTVQGLVGGNFECSGVGPDVFILCNEDGIALDLPDNCGYKGTILFVGKDGDEFGTLDEEDLGKALRWCKKHEGERHVQFEPQIISGNENIRRELERAGRSVVEEWGAL